MSNNSREKIMFSTVDMAGGGAERVISILANRMVEMGIDVSILMTAGDTVSYELDPRVELLSAGGKSGGSNMARLKRISAIRSILREHREYTVVAFGPSPAFFTWVSGLGLHMDFCVSERNDPAACPHPKLRNFVFARARVMVCQTEDALKAFPDKLQRKGAVIPNPVRNDLPDMEHTTHRPHTIAAVGRLQPQKNYPLLLEAFAIFHKNHPDYVLHVYGKGELLPELQDKCRDLGPAVVWEGFRRDVLEQIRHAGIYVLSSDYEGISNALLEAMALGLPVISTDCPIGGSRMCIEDGTNGLLVPCRDAEALALAMGRLADDEALADRLGQQAYHIRETYAEQRITEEWVKAVL